MSGPVIGFIGIGIMGDPMAHHLLKAGYQLRVWNRTAEKLHSLRVAGATPCTNAREVVQGASTVICMLSGDATCNSVILEDGVLTAMKIDTTLVMMSSIGVETALYQAQRSAEHKVRYLDAPVSGGQKGAREATLAIMVGATEEDFAATAPLLASMGRPVHVGPVGCGELSKLANQMIVAGTIAIVAEALLLVQQGGADPARVRDALAGGFADSPILQLHAKRMIENDFAPGGPAKWQLKDMRNAIGFSKSLNLSLPITDLVSSMFEQMVKHGDGELDHSGLIRELRRKNLLSVE
jgi:3-hydroxyisobutyrate dehydrogenase-like beta-hydroxyacid dehydrogenase